MEFYFFECKHCGNMIYHMVSSGLPVSCCGERMKEVTPKTADSAVEKHVPVVEVNGREVTVTVGSTKHPMTEDHSIKWIILETKNGFQKKDLPSTGEPVAKFTLSEGDEVVAAYEYCNLHGLWKA